MTQHELTKASIQAQTVALTAITEARRTYGLRRREWPMAVRQAVETLSAAADEAQAAAQQARRN